MDPTARISFSAYLDSIITRQAVILSYDYTRSVSAKTYIGRNCLIGVNAIVMPGATIGNEVVMGAGAVVTRDMPSNSLVVENPAQVVGHIKSSAYGRVIEKM